MTEKQWDFTSQQAATYYSVAQILAEGKVAEGTEIVLELFFAPQGDADAVIFLKALKTFGYLGEPQDNGAVLVNVSGIALGADAVWLQEERTTKLALPRGYTPDGWGFSEP